MKILWLTETPSKYKSEQISYNGRGWIASLQSLLENCPQIDHLGIAFPHAGETKKHSDRKVTYYPIKKVVAGNIFSWIHSNWKFRIEHKEEINQLKAIVEDFQPDVIHIFGTESWLGHVVEMTDKPCVVHLQGVLLSCINTYVPTGFSTFDLIKYSWSEFVRGISLWHFQQVFEKKAKREYVFFKKIPFFMGRTNWDKSLSGYLSPKSTYFHVDEVLRDRFYTASPWRYVKRHKILITSTLSDSLYKGLDLVVKTAEVLVREKIEFEWRVIGVNANSKSVRILKKKFHLEFAELNINLLGIRNSDQIIDLLSETTLYVHPSYIDNSPNSLCEAQLMGVPVIATNVGGVSSLIEEGKDGFLVPANDPYFLASRIVQISANQQLLNFISIHGSEKAKQRHSKEKILDQLIETYQFITVNTLKKSGPVEKAFHTAI